MKADTLVLYIRISKEDGDCHMNGKGESNSITNQRSLLEDYIKRNPELAQYRAMEVCDDGYSGTNLNRPGMERLLKMARKGQVACILVKDFSRFGRDYLTVSDYLDQIFPFMGIRFISVNDQYDSAKCQGITSGVDMAFRNVVYGYYSQDLSIKTKSGKRARAEKGDFMGSFAPIGYKKSPEDKHKLVIEPEGAMIVRKIFGMAGAGMDVQQIARGLNRERIPTPGQLKNKMGQSHKWWVGLGDRKVWDDNVVRDILRDERYLGKNIYGRYARVGLGDYRVKKTGREKWVIVDGCHKPLVSEEEFAAAREKVGIFCKHGSRVHTVNLFAGKLKCASCGYALERIKKPVPHYRCRTREKVEGCGCMEGNLGEQELTETVFSSIRLYLKALLDGKRMREEAEENGRLPRMRKRLAVLQADIRGFQEQKAILYDGFLDQKISRSEFQGRQEKLSRQQDEAQRQYDVLQGELSQLEQFAEARRREQKEWEDCLGAEGLTRGMVEAFVERIDVYSDKSIHIQWKFGDVVG